MTIKELLKDDAETLQKVEEAIKKVNDSIGDNNKKVKFTDLGEGKYVGVEKYNDLESKYNELKNTPNEFETKYNDLVATQNETIAGEKEKLNKVAKQLAVESAVNSLGIEDKLTLAGIKSLIDVNSIQLGDDYKVTGGLSEQISSIKDTYKDSFNTQVSVVSTGETKPSGSSSTSKVYSSRAEIEALSQSEVSADLENITRQLANLK